MQSDPQALLGGRQSGPRLLVQYYSRTGGTKEMAVLVGEGAASVPGAEVRVLSFDSTTAADLVWCEGLALGAPTHFGSVPWELKRWWDEVAAPLWMTIDGKIGCVFSSCGGLGGGAELSCLALLTILMNYGFLVFGVPDYVARGVTLHYGAALPGGARDDAGREACRRLGRRLAEWVSALAHGRADLHPLRSAYPRHV